MSEEQAPAHFKTDLYQGDASSRVLPQDWEAERTLLGGLITDSGRLSDVRGILQPRHFHRPSHGKLYALLLTLPTDFDVSHVLDATFDREEYGDRLYVLSTGNAWHGENLESLAGILVDLWRRRAFILACQVSISEAVERANPIADVLAAGEKRVTAITSAGVGAADWIPFAEIVPDLIPEYERRQALWRESGGKGVIGIATRLPMLDALTQGLHRTDVTVIAGRPGCGKTVVALNLAIWTALQGHAVGVFSLEMSKHQLAGRTVSSEGEVPAHDLRSGNIGSHWGAIIDAVGILKDLPVFVDDCTAQTAATLRAKARRLKQLRPDLALIVLDYLQLAGGGERGQSREHVIAELSRTCKIIAKELDVAFVVLSQLSRECEKRSDKRPMLSDLRESGAIEQDCDNAWLLYKDDTYNELSPDKGLMEIIIPKQRNGPLGTVKVGFRGDLMKVVAVDPSDPRHQTRPPDVDDSKGWRSKK